LPQHFSGDGRDFTIREDSESRSAVFLRGHRSIAACAEDHPPTFQNCILIPVTFFMTVPRSVDYNGTKEFVPMNSFFSPSKQTKGQGLVEYAIIVALVAIVVIVVVQTLGPTIGNTFSTINNSLGEGGIGGAGEEEETPVPTSPPDDFVHVADEGETFNVPAGMYEVRYGANGTYFTQFISGPTTKACNAATFGDPLPGVPKSCSMRQSP
jgi:pilus assembly protein Flp/PilA